jgi:hypothetical protein
VTRTISHVISSGPALVPPWTRIGSPTPARSATATSTAVRLEATARCGVGEGVARWAARRTLARARRTMVPTAATERYNPLTAASTFVRDSLASPNSSEVRAS